MSARQGLGLAKRSNGAIAQLVEHLHGMQGVSGSSPLGSTDSNPGKARVFFMVSGSTTYEQGRRVDIAVFDVDHTLLDGDCVLLLARTLHPMPSFLLRSLGLLPSLLAWSLGRCPTDRFKELFLARFILSSPPDPPHPRLMRLLSGEFSHRLVARLRPAALARLRWHQEQGHRVILCSASPRIVLQGLADRLGVEIVATELMAAEGRWLPKLQGANCKGPEKIRRLESYLGGLDSLRIEAYGDSKGDRELLKRADLPHYRSFLPTPTPYPQRRNS